MREVQNFKGIIYVIIIYVFRLEKKTNTVDTVTAFYILTLDLLQFTSSSTKSLGIILIIVMIIMINGIMFSGNEVCHTFLSLVGLFV